MTGRNVANESPSACSCLTQDIPQISILVLVIKSRIAAIREIVLPKNNIGNVSALILVENGRRDFSSLGENDDGLR